MNGWAQFRRCQSKKCGLTDVYHRTNVGDTYVTSVNWCRRSSSSITRLDRNNRHSVDCSGRRADLEQGHWFGWARKCVQRSIFYFDIKLTLWPQSSSIRPISAAYSSHPDSERTRLSISCSAISTNSPTISSQIPAVSGITETMKACCRRRSRRGNQAGRSGRTGVPHRSRLTGSS